MPLANRWIYIVFLVIVISCVSNSNFPCLCSIRSSWIRYSVQFSLVWFAWNRFDYNTEPIVQIDALSASLMGSKLIRIRFLFLGKVTFCISILLMRIYIVTHCIRTFRAEIRGGSANPIYAPRSGNAASKERFRGRLNASITVYETAPSGTSLQNKMTRLVKSCTRNSSLQWPFCSFGLCLLVPHNSGSSKGRLVSMPNCSSIIVRFRFKSLFLLPSI